MSQRGRRPLSDVTLREFENGYWYLDQLKGFAARIGIPSANKLRKDELEADKTATRAEVIAAWKELKKLDVPKDYASWVKARRRPSLRR